MLGEALVTPGHPVSREGALLLELHDGLLAYEEEDTVILLRRVNKIRDRQRERWERIAYMAFQGAAGRPPEGEVTVERDEEGRLYLTDDRGRAPVGPQK